MARAPSRPVRLRLVLGKAASKGRRESDNPTRYLVEQVSIAFATERWEEVRTVLKDRIEQDVRAELTHIAGQFRRNVIGAPGSQRGLVGALTTVTKGVGQPRDTLGGLPRWAPRGAKYLERKRDSLGHTNWFDNTGWNDGGKWPENPGTLREFFKSETGGDGGSTNIGSGGMFEQIFGGISVQVLRNNRGWGVNQGTIKLNARGTQATVQLATVRVRALGKVTDRMLAISDQPNYALFNKFIEAGERDVALRLRGGQGRYRPALEPYLKFFLERSVPFAVSARIQRGLATGGLLKT